jgi:hypothetical protein
MNLHEIGLKYKTDKSTYHNFMYFYETHLSFMRQQPINMLEIGFFKGSSIRTWLEYFSNATINCIDIIDVDFTHERFIYNKISQEDTRLKELFLEQSFDLIIDDGSHMTSHQNRSLELLWPKLKNGGLYILEDLHTSFVDSYIDSPITPYKFLKKEAEIEELEHIHEESEYIKIFHKVPDLYTDSITSIIKKKEDLK